MNNAILFEVEMRDVVKIVMDDSWNGIFHGLS